MVRKCQYDVYYNGMVKEFDSEEEARKFMADWAKVKEEISYFTDKVFQNYESGLIVNMEWKVVP